ncbi:MAG TPA: phosphatidylglycerol lysyltransferase domain-containing protein [Gaiellaceae bacterium]|nr:phosphatidylglycerol lysyltransferase domain-containing protein [Gaiellaceae bacterium]
MRAGALSAAFLAGLAVVVTATGWLYLLRPYASGAPRIGEVLPLDELAKRGAVSIFLFVAVWCAVGLLLGLIARAAGAERLTAALLLALGVGLWGYLATGVAILTVRQIPAHAAFTAAASLRAVYVPAALAGLGGAVVGRLRTTTSPRAPLVLAAAVAVTGLVGVLDAVLPERSGTLLQALAPERVHPLASALVGPLGLALVLLARGLARRKRRAHHLAVALLFGLAALHVLHGFDGGAAFAAFVAVALVARRQDFDAPGDPYASPRLIVRAALAIAAIYAYGASALWINRISADQPFTLGFAARETTRSLAGLALAGSPHVGDAFGRWFPLSVFIAGLAAAGWLLAAWLAPWRYRHRQEARERATARALVARWGADTLAPFVLRADKSYFFSEDERAFLAYRVVGGVAVVSGDPIGPPSEFGRLVERFIAFARARDWRIAILGACERCLDLYRAHGLHALYHGDEAVLETASFSLDGRPIRKVRQSVHRLTVSGYTSIALYPREIGPELRSRMESIAREWRGTAPSRGFVMALDALFRLEGEDALFVIGRNADGEPEGFLHFAVSQPGSALSLSSMPRLRTTPNGFNEWLVCETVEWARAHRIARISLNFAPFAALLAPQADLSALQRVERRALLSLKGHFQLDNLLLFNRKFFPSWERRFVVYERRRDLPRVGIAALAAEAYLPFSGRDRDRE